MTTDKVVGALVDGAGPFVGDYHESSGCCGLEGGGRHLRWILARARINSIPRA